MDVREKLEVIAHLGDHISYKEDIGICYDSDLAKVIEDAYMSLENGVTVQEWISVKDRLPEKVGTRVLTYSPEDGVNIGKFIGYNAFVVHLWDVFCHQHRTTHWMPLPDPPEGIWL